MEYRIRHLGDERAIALLGKLAELSGWRQRSPGVPDDGWGMGFARFKNRSSYVGVVMRVSVDMDSEKIELKQAYAVCDAGLIINPDGASAQIEGGVVQSSSWTIKEQIRFSNSEKQSRDWASYPILRFDEVPDVTVAFMERKDHPSLGLGEAAQGPRREFFYFSDDGVLVATRIDDWKIVFAEQRARRFDVWRDPFITLRIPKVFHLRRDPLERADTDSNSYNLWWDHKIAAVGALGRVEVGRFVQSLQALHRPRRWSHGAL